MDALFMQTRQCAVWFNGDPWHFVVHTGVRQAVHCNW